MRARCFSIWILSLLALIPATFAQTVTNDRIQVTLDTSEADQVLAIVALHQAGKPISEVEWQKLFATAPYQRLKEREQKIGEKFHDFSQVFTDEDFKKFVLSDAILQRATQLGETLEQWKQADLRRAAERSSPISLRALLSDPRSTPSSNPE